MLSLQRKNNFPAPQTLLHDTAAKLQKQSIQFYVQFPFQRKPQNLTDTSKDT